MNRRLILSGLAACVALCVIPGTAHAQIFVANCNPDSFGTCQGTIGEYTTSGTTVKAALVSGLNNALAIAVSGGDLFVVNGDSGTIGEYTTSGATVNAALVSGLRFFGIAVAGGDLFVTNFNNLPNSGTIGEYTTSGATVNATLVSGLGPVAGIAVSGANLFV